MNSPGAPTIGKKLRRGVLAGHLLNAPGDHPAIYFADPGFRTSATWRGLGFPIGVVDADGGVTITKLRRVRRFAFQRQTCKEQLLYEIDDPARYMQARRRRRFSQVTVEEVGRRRSDRGHRRRRAETH